MKIAIPAQNNDLDSQVDVRFGRAKGFIIYDTETGNHEWVSNTRSVQSAQGAGIQAAKNLIDSGAQVLITGNVGPKSYSLLKASGIDMYLCNVTAVKTAIEDFKSNKLQKVSDATVEGHW